MLSKLDLFVTLKHADRVLQDGGQLQLTMLTAHTVIKPCSRTPKMFGTMFLNCERLSCINQLYLMNVSAKSLTPMLLLEVFRERTSPSKETATAVCTSLLFGKAWYVLISLLETMAGGVFWVRCWLVVQGIQIAHRRVSVPTTVTPRSTPLPLAYS